MCVGVVGIVGAAPCKFLTDREITGEVLGEVVGMVVTMVDVDICRTAADVSTSPIYFLSESKRLSYGSIL